MAVPHSVDQTLGFSQSPDTTPVKGPKDDSQLASQLAGALSHTSCPASKSVTQSGRPKAPVVHHRADSIPS